MIAGRLAAIALAAALAGCAAAPADETTPAAPPFAGDLASAADLIGLSAVDVQAALGAPDVQRQDGDARIWQYRADGCVLDVFFYGAADSAEARHAETRDLKGAIEDGPDCIDALRDRATLAS